MVMAFDQFGKQMEEFQGPCSEIMQKLLDINWEGEIIVTSWRGRL
jgi:hypothetical protein